MCSHVPVVHLERGGGLGFPPPPKDKSPPQMYIYIIIIILSKVVRVITTCIYYSILRHFIKNHSAISLLGPFGGASPPRPP